MYSELSTSSAKTTLPLFRGRGRARLHSDIQLLDEVLTDESVDHFLRELELQWEVQSLHWIRQDRVDLYAEVLDLTVRAAYHWIGMPFPNRGFDRRVDRYRRMLRERGTSRWATIKGIWSRWREQEKLRRFFAKIQAKPKAFDGRALGPQMGLLVGLDGRYIDPSRLSPVLLDFLKSIAETSLFVPFAAQTMRIDEEFRHDISWEVGTGKPRHDIVSGSINLAVKYLTDRLTYDVSSNAVAPERLVIINVERQLFSIGHR